MPHPEVQGSFWFRSAQVLWDGRLRVLGLDEHEVGAARFEIGSGGAPAVLDGPRHARLGLQLEA